MGYKSDARDVTFSTLDELKPVLRKISELEARKDDFSEKKYNELASQLETERKKIIRDGRSQIDTLYEQYVQKMHTKYTLKPENVTDDVKLLSGAFKLDQQALDAMMEKYPDNITMQNAINNYAEQRKIILVHYPKSEENAINNGAILKPFYDSVMQKPEFEDQWRDEQYYNNFTEEIED